MKILKRFKRDTLHFLRFGGCLLQNHGRHWLGVINELILYVICDIVSLQPSIQKYHKVSCGFKKRTPTCENRFYVLSPICYGLSWVWHIVVWFAYNNNFKTIQACLLSKKIHSHKVLITFVYNKILPTQIKICRNV